MANAGERPTSPLLSGEYAQRGLPEVVGIEETWNLDFWAPSFEVPFMAPGPRRIPFLRSAKKCPLRHRLEELREDPHGANLRFRPRKARQRREIELIPVSELNFCPFCRKNGEPPEVFESHRLKDPNGVTTCPKLRAYSCRICHNGGGDFAHTMRYCPKLAKPKQPQDFHQKGLQ
ncbi:nanos homolog 3-like [Galendromus occidentalis]|uniref:Nanos homolog 3-like n=1 Tax=Galendromus occidentalis TaxID=34638 RepID=A0AAJ7L5Q5_9ACAR|nr:nanos homolog 3-like [Galendromus occidentalis]